MKSKSDTLTCNLYLRKYFTTYFNHWFPTPTQEHKILIHSNDKIGVIEGF